MDKPYNRYIEEKIELFMKFIYKWGYNDYELKPVYHAVMDALREDKENEYITNFEYYITAQIIDTLFRYAERVCIDIRDKERWCDYGLSEMSREAKDSTNNTI